MMPIIGINYEKTKKQTYHTLTQATKFPKKHVVNLALLNFDLAEQQSFIFYWGLVISNFFYVDFVFWFSSKNLR